VAAHTAGGYRLLDPNGVSIALALQRERSAEGLVAGAQEIFDRRL
jgi:hypothetical protein